MSIWVSGFDSVNLLLGADGRDDCVSTGQQKIENVSGDEARPT